MPSRSFLFVSLAVLVIGYLGLNLLVRWIYPKQLFPYRGTSYETLPGLKSVASADGFEIAFTFLPAESPGAPLLFYLHGNGEDIGMNADRFEWFRQKGFSVVALDYPGYGLSTGKPTAKSVREATRAVWKYAVGNLGASAEQTVVWGRSLGGAPATWLASQESFGGLILESTFRSVFAVADLPVPLLLPEPFPTETLIASVSAPIILFHGKQDRIIPFAHSQRLAQAAGENARLVLFPEGSHNDLRYVGEARMAAALESLHDELVRPMTAPAGEGPATKPDP